MTSIKPIKATGWWERWVHANYEPVNMPLEPSLIERARAVAENYPTPPIPTSVIEQTALQLNRALEGFTNQETILVAEIQAKTELLRQVRASKLAVSTGLETLDGDPALGEQTVPTDVADQMEAAISEELL